MRQGAVLRVPESLGEVHAMLPELGTMRPSMLTPAACADHIAALFAAATMLGEMFQAQTMESCWRIWTAAEPEEAERLVREKTPLTVERSKRYADCWEQARGNRAVMDLAVARPNAALRLVADVADTLSLDAGDDEVGREVARLAALPARRRTEELRGLVAAKGTASRPEDVARIAELEDANAALEHERAQAAAAQHPAAAWKEFAAKLGEAADAVDDLRRRAERLGAAPESRRSRLLPVLDHLVGAADAVSALLAGAD